MGGRLNIPIYEGGQTYAQIRQAKETVGQTRIQVDQVRDQVRAQIVDFWGRLEAAKAQVIAAQAQVQANEVALNGVREEARVGQRTTLDVLNAQQELLTSRVNLIVAQRDRVIYLLRRRSGDRTADRALHGAAGRVLQRQGPLRSGQGSVVRPAHAGRALRSFPRGVWCGRACRHETAWNTD